MDKHCDSIHYETLWIMDLQSYTTKSQMHTEGQNTEKVQILLLCLIQIFYTQKGKKGQDYVYTRVWVWTH